MKKPKRIFRSARPPADPRGPELRRMVDALTAGRPPELRHALYEATAALAGPAAMAVFCSLGPGARGEFLLAWKHAVDDLAGANPKCDVCAAAARHVRLVAIHPGEDFGAVRVPDHPGATLACWLIVCERCAARKSDRQLKRAMLGKLATVQATSGPGPYRSPVLIGQRVGAVGHLSPGHSLEQCRACSQPVWIDTAEVDRLGEVIGLTFLCRGCADRDLAAGRLESAPVPFEFL